MKPERVERKLRYHLRYAAILAPLILLLLIGGYYLVVTHDPLLWR